MPKPLGAPDPARPVEQQLPVPQDANQISEPAREVGAPSSGFDKFIGALKVVRDAFLGILAVPLHPVSILLFCVTFGSSPARFLIQQTSTWLLRGSELFADPKRPSSPSKADEVAAAPATPEAAAAAATVEATTGATAAEASTGRAATREKLASRVGQLLLNRPLPRGLLGEEHVNAMLFENLKDRDDVTILFSRRSGELEIPNELPPGTRYVVFALSVNNNTHNTGLVVDIENNSYTYLDSYGGECPQNTLTACEDGGLLKPGYTQNVFVHRTNQKDGWSCGLHVVENVTNFIKRTVPASTRPSGNALYDKQSRTFSTFVNKYGKTEAGIDDTRLQVRHKKRIQYGLKAAGVHENEGHPLHQLYQEVVKELHVDAEDRVKNRSLADFVADYTSRFPGDVEALSFLRELQTPNSDLYRIAIATTIEAQELSDQREADIGAYVTEKYLRPPSAGGGARAAP
jgi:hypothetical protein